MNRTRSVLPALMLATMLIASCSTFSKSSSTTMPSGVIPALTQIKSPADAERALVIIQQLHVVSRNSLATAVNQGTVAKTSSIVTKYADLEQKFTNFWDQAALAVDVWKAIGSRGAFDTSYSSAAENLVSLQNWQTLPSGELRLPIEFFELEVAA